jgi:uncharacterized damage-inducible protein DinB
MTAKEAIRHFHYSGWASRRLLEAMKQVSPEEARRDVNISHRSIFGTLAHIYFADLIWYSRTVDPGVKVHAPADVLTDAELVEGWADVQQRWEQWAASLDDRDLDRVVHYVNHATLHRGQVMGMLRQAGVAPPPTDLIFFLRESK